MMPISDYTSAELLVIVGAVILLSLLLAEMCDWTRVLFDSDIGLCNYSYNYAHTTGPAAWSERFPESLGHRQSPINLSSSLAMVVPTDTTDPLEFSPEYTRLPKEVRIFNDGHAVLLYARWLNDERPVISGGPLEDCYQFFNACFRWGPNDYEGSEHTVDCRRHAMELQVVHVKVGKKYDSLKQAAEDRAVLIVSYFYDVTPVENLYLQQLVDALKKIRVPFTCVDLDPLPLSFFIPPFYSSYFRYCGSLTHPPCTEGVQWLVQPEPLGISARQVAKFRKLCSSDGPIDINTRPVQTVNSREVFYYD